MAWFCSAAWPVFTPALTLERYRQQYPGLEVEIAEGTAHDSVIQLRANLLDVTFVAGSPNFPDCHTRRIWSERLLAALSSRHPLAKKGGVTWTELTEDTFIVRRGGTGPQVHGHIVLRLASCCRNLAILRFDVERGTLLSMVALGYGVTIVGDSASLVHAPGVTFLPILDEPEPLAFSAVWSPYNRSPLLRNLLTLASEMGRSMRTT